MEGVGYSEDDIWNLDETRCFWKALPDKGLGQQARPCKRGRNQSKELQAAGKQEYPPLEVSKSPLL